MAVVNFVLREGFLGLTSNSKPESMPVESGWRSSMRTGLLSFSTPFSIAPSICLRFVYEWLKPSRIARWGRQLNWGQTWPDRGRLRSTINSKGQS